jgi:hypothetical protein
VRVPLWPLFACSTWAQTITDLAGTAGEGAFGPLFARTAWAQSATVMASTTIEDTTLAFVRSVVVGSDRHCGGGHVM